MRPRKTHHKSRNGCLQCKKRKIKCDESAPACAPCVKHRVQCSFTPITPSSSRSAPSTPPHELAHAAYISPSRLVDLELLHNFIQSTTVTLTNHPDVRKVYQNEVISLGFKYDYLLHAILAVSGFHLAYQIESGALNPPSLQSHQHAEDYLLTAHSHYNAALQSLHPSITEVTRENCHSLFACSCLIFIASSAIPKRATGQNGAPALLAAESSMERILEWMMLLRGVMSVATREIQWVLEGPLALMMMPKSGDYDGKNIDAKYAAHMDELFSFLANNFDPVSAEICQIALTKLRSCFAGVFLGQDPGQVFLWVCRLSDEFLGFLKELRAEALLVLACWCGLMQSGLMYRTEWTWWMRAWPKLVAEVISANLDEGLMCWMRRPWEWAESDQLKVAP